MATTKISELTALTTTDGAEELVINDGGTSKKVTIANLLVDDQVTAAKLANSINTDIATGVTANTTANAALPKAGGTMTGVLTLNANGSHIVLDTLAAGQNNWVTWKDNGTSKWEINKNTTHDFRLYSYTLGSEVITFKETGNVGIGTSTIANESDHKKLVISGDSGTGAGMIEFADTSNNIDGAIFADGGNLFIVADRDNATADSSIRFRVDGSSEKMRILSNGHVRIGDITSSQNVVASMLNIKSLLNVPALHLTNSGSAEALHILAGNNSSNYVIRTVDENSGADVFTVKKDGGAETSGKFDMYVSGNVGIGDSDPSEAKLSIDNILAGDTGIKLINSQDTISLYINSESTSQAAIETASKIGLVISQDLANGYAGLFTRNLSETGSYPLVKIADNNASNTQDALQIKQVGTGIGLFIDQNGNNAAIKIDSEATGDGAIEIWSKYGLQSVQDISGGQAGYFTRDISEAGSNPLVEIKDDHTSNTQPALQVQQDGAGRGLFIDQNGNGDALYIDSEAAGSYAAQIYGKYGLRVNQDISSGYAGKFYRNLAEAGSNPLVEIKDDHTSNTQPTLKIQQDGTGHGIDMTTVKRGIQVVGGGTDDAAAWFLNSTCETGSGSALQAYSNSAHTGTRNVCKIHNDHVDATGTTALRVMQDSTGLAADFTGTGGIRSAGGILFGSDTAAANQLDDYEEGTWDAVVRDSGGNAATMNASYTTQRYTKVGRLVTCHGYFGITSKASMASSSGVTIYGLPFAVGNSTDLSTRSTSSILCRNITSAREVHLEIVEDRTYLRLQRTVSGSNPAIITSADCTDAFSGNISFSYTV